MQHLLGWMVISRDYCEDFELIDYDVNPGDEIWMYNYVKENGYNVCCSKV